MDAPTGVAQATPQRSDHDLAAALAGGDASALTEIYDRFHRAVHSVAFRVTTDRTHAEDVVQEVFVGLWKRPAGFDPTRGSLGTWLMAAAHHKAVDLVRHEESLRRRRDKVTAEVEQEFREEQTSEPVEDQATERWQAERVRTALSSLPDAQREAMVMAYFGGYTQREISSLTGVPLGTVKTRMLSAMRKLRDVLAPLGGDVLGHAAGELRGLEGGAL